MENTKAAILVLAIAAALIVTATGAYAMGRVGNNTGTYPNTAYGAGMGPSMMGGSYGYAGGMMGGHGMMGAWNGTGSMHEYMEQYCPYYNSTAVP